VSDLERKSEDSRFMSAYGRELKGVVGCGSASSSVVSRDRGKSEER
jgi:hypothetical protein